MALDLHTASFSFAVFASKTKTNFEGETLHRTPISVTPSDIHTSGVWLKILPRTQSTIFFRRENKDEYPVQR